MITGRNKSKFSQKIYHANVNVNLTEKKSGIIINVNASVKNMIYVKKNIFGILLHVVTKMENI